MNGRDRRRRGVPADKSGDGIPAEVPAEDMRAEDVDGEWEMDEPGARRPRRVREPGHVSADLEWVSSDEDDPDAGSGRTDADDGGYLPGEGTGRPYPM
jgi:hypothetical protein